MNALLNWLDDRTGYRRQVHEVLYENIPGGARWRYVTGSMLVFAFVTQAITGVFLWMAYSPGSQNAWESVYYIQNEMQGGWLLRGVHHFMAQAMVVLLPIHMLQVIWDKAYLPPREFNFWTGLVLMLIVLALSLTGYLLPWDQKGYWATKVATNLMSLAPLGEYAQKLVVGGSNYGHFTLTRFFGLHTGVLPPLLIGFLVLHIALFRRHGITSHPSASRADEYFWPGQVLKDAVACLLLLVIVLLATVHFDIGGVIALDLPEAHRGAHLTAPADSVEEYKAARPEWYFLFLFQLLKKFEKDEFLGAIVIPGVIMAYLFLMPLLGRIKIGHYANVSVFLALFVGAGYLTAEALYYDDYDSYVEFDEAKAAELEGDELAKYERPFKAAEEYKEAVRQGEEEYERAKLLIEYYGIPREGALALLQDDPETMGPRLFRRNCASCHAYTDAEGNGIAGPTLKEGELTGAPNLYEFASRGWIEGILDPERVAGPDYFGHTAHGEDGSMVYFVQEDFEATAEEKKQIAAALSAKANLPYQSPADAEAIAAGQTLLVDHCADCHQVGGEFDGEDGPDLRDYGSHKWIKQFIANPNHERFYGENNDRMPAFAEYPDDTSRNLLSDHELEMLVRWLRKADKDLERKLKLARGEQGEAESSGADASSEDASTEDTPSEEASADEPSNDDAASDDAASDDAASDDAAGDETPATSSEAM